VSGFAAPYTVSDSPSVKVKPSNPQREPVSTSDVTVPRLNANLGIIAVLLICQTVSFVGQHVSCCGHVFDGGGEGCVTAAARAAPRCRASGAGSGCQRVSSWAGGYPIWVAQADPDGRELSPAEELRMMRVADGSPQHERQFGPVGVDAPADGSLGGLALQPDTAGAGDHRRVDGVPSAGVEFVDCLLVRTTMVRLSGAASHNPDCFSVKAETIFRPFRLPMQPPN